MTTDQQDETVTADDVAERAGVSRWTVSRAFKPHAPVSQKTRDKVLKAAHDLGYAPDLLAASLASDRSNLVALLIDDFANPHKLVILDQLTRTLRAKGWDTLLVNTLGKDDAPQALLTASQRRVDAAVLIGVEFDETLLQAALGARRVRKLILFGRQSAHPGTISICCDDQRAMAEIVDFVQEKGYARPLFLAGPQTTTAHLMRKETFLAHWHNSTGRSMPFVPVTAYDPQLAYDKVAQLLRGTDAPAPDILVCENDALALGAMDALRFELGKSVPEDIAVIGFDDVPQAAMPQYQLTTYRQPMGDMIDGLIRVLNADVDGLRPFAGSLVPRCTA